MNIQTLALYYFEFNDPVELALVSPHQWLQFAEYYRNGYVHYNVGEHVMVDTSKYNSEGFPQGEFVEIIDIKPFWYKENFTFDYSCENVLNQVKSLLPGEVRKINTRKYEK